MAGDANTDEYISRLQEGRSVTTPSGVEFTMQMPKSSSPFWTMYKKFSSDKQKEYFNAVVDAADAYSRVHEARNRIMPKNLQARIDAQTNAIHADKVRSEKELRDAIAERDVAGVLVGVHHSAEKARLEAELADSLHQKKLSEDKLSLLDESVDDYKKRLERENQKNLEATRKRGSALLEEAKINQQLRREFDQCCTAAIAEYKEYVRINFERDVDMTKGSIDFQEIQALENHYAKLKQDL